MLASQHDSTNRAPHPRQGDIVIRHFGTLVQNCHIIAISGGKVWDYGPTPFLSEQQVRDSITASVGEPFLSIPGKEPLPKEESLAYHEIVGRTVSGSDIPRITLEMVFNDWETINRDHGDGAYESAINFAEREVLKVALELYKPLLDERKQGRAKDAVQ
jgi:hypothetical protein